MEGRISNEKLRNICTHRGWFTNGTIGQYERMFYMNESGAGIEEIATVIWLCSDDEDRDNDRREILFELHEAGFTERKEKSEKEHLAEWLGI